ncbi:MAG TPA: flagellar motor switch protein FliG [Gammaproteobacteria bacterium]|nr:flagellar motor switch protein FliG [Gammaproteobacteria bacterium]
MTGTEKAAIFLLSIGEQAAAKVMKHLDEATVNNLSVAMSRVRRMDRGEADQVVGDFLAQLDDQTSHSVDSFQYVRQVLDEAVGEREAARVMEYIMRGGSMAMTMDIMRETDPAMLAEQMRTERPQAIALILAHLEAGAGSELLSHLPEDVARDVLYRYARLDSVQPHVLRELGAMLSEQLSGQVGAQQLSGIGGPRKAADLLNNLQSSTTESLLNKMAEQDAKLVDTIRENMFTFSDLVQLDSRALQTLMREVSTEELVPALKAAPPEVVDKILSNVSTRAAEAIREDLESGPPVRRSEAENAQKAILRIARRLDSEGQITISTEEDLL